MDVHSHLGVDKT